MTAHRTILFVDVVSSTELYEHLGDEDARARIGPCLGDLEHLVAEHGGMVVKSLGDGILAAFAGEAAAVAAGIRMPELAGRCGLQVRVGVHTGDVLEEGGDLFGQAVNIASRLSALARPSEVLVTEEVVARLTPELQVRARRLHDVAIKGLRETQELFAIGQPGPSVDLTLPVGGQAAHGAAGLEIRLGDRAWDPARSVGLRLGRDPANDIVVNGDRVSRRHATITNRRGTCVLADQSVNGTWLAPAGGPPVQLLREEATLLGSGTIVLGVPPDDPEAVPISYRSAG